MENGILLTTVCTRDTSTVQYSYSTIQYGTEELWYISSLLVHMILSFDDASCCLNSGTGCRSSSARSISAL